MEINKIDDVVARLESQLRSKGQSIAGSSDSKNWCSPSVLWRDVKDEWYEEAKEYWDNEATPTMDGVLGGFAKLDAPDIKMSAAFLHKLRSDWSGAVAADIAAGIGRVTKNLLLPLGFTRVDLVEQSQPLIGAAPEFLQNIKENQTCRFLCLPMQKWRPNSNDFDLIWVQWCIGHFTDSHFIQFLHTCRDALTADGLLVIKDNVLGTEKYETQQEAFYVDDDDRSICRSYAYLRSLFDIAGATVLAESQQATSLHQTDGCDDTFPPDIYPVFAFALVWKR